VYETPRVRFGVARNGWLPFQITVGSRLDFTVSDVPNDFLTELSGALVAILTASGEAEAVASEEPAEVRLIFSSEVGRASLQVERQRDHRRRTGAGETLLVAHAPSVEVARAFWRALRELEGRSEWEEFPQHWGHPFPVRQVRSLGEML
jgi:hypothetical protein